MLKNTTKTSQRPDQALARGQQSFTRFLDERLARTRISLDLTFTLVCAILLLVKVLFAPGPLGPPTTYPESGPGASQGLPVLYPDPTRSPKTLVKVYFPLWVLGIE